MKINEKQRQNNERIKPDDPLVFVLFEFKNWHCSPINPLSHVHLSGNVHFPLEEQTFGSFELHLKQFTSSHCVPLYLLSQEHMSNEIHLPFELQTVDSLNKFP